MIRELVYNNTPLPLYKNALDAYADRHRAVASNIANASTPGFTSTRVSFEKQLTKALDRHGHRGIERPLGPADPDHPNNVRHSVWKDEDNANANGANGVVIEREISTMLTNSMQYSMVAKRTAGLFTRMRMLGSMK
ncbi:flagellar basal body rod protein FlgB [bacterium]|nr:flagellar basal body rod protein FlgB [bacterium]